ncbi:hypothetical protein PROFUN_16456 [Planoprotostelium fungivorum]|uniref:Uncharacterized protein n=1 Tax=Planoprotostelium fungivorum TaxID=1890364 RepID=A0A2P6MQN8_9EUKA|nr:hypothetical protein PROFUN_16456 [Planoprotostelium fungivorum]
MERADNLLKERLRLEKNAAAKLGRIHDSLYHRLYLALLGLQFKEDQPLAALEEHLITIGYSLP